MLRRQVVNHLDDKFLLQCLLGLSTDGLGCACFSCALCSGLQQIRKNQQTASPRAKDKINVTIALSAFRDKSFTFLGKSRFIVCNLSVYFTAPIGTYDKQGGTKMITVPHVVTQLFHAVVEQQKRAYCEP